MSSSFESAPLLHRMTAAPREPHRNPGRVHFRKRVKCPTALSTITRKQFNITLLIIQFNLIILFWTAINKTSIPARPPLPEEADCWTCE
jgi:hypothetical protein